MNARKTAAKSATRTATKLPRGRPANPKVKLAILRAAAQILDAGGIGAVTMEAVAERAGVGKPTVYRWFADRHAVAMAALMAIDDDAYIASSGKLIAISQSPIRMLRKQLHSIVARFATSSGRHVASMIAAADRESEMAKAFRNHFVLTRRTEGRTLLQQAISVGDVRKDINIEVVLDAIYGPLFFRLLLGHAPLDAAFVDKLLHELIHGIGADSD
jgi:AcrR family transcriptional regulator